MFFLLVRQLASGLDDLVEVSLHERNAVGNYSVRGGAEPEYLFLLRCGKQNHIRERINVLLRGLKFVGLLFQEKEVLSGGLYQPA